MRWYVSRFDIKWNQGRVGQLHIFRKIISENVFGELYQQLSMGIKGVYILW